MIINIVIMSLAVILLVWFLKEKCHAYSLKEVLIKTSISLLFIVVGLVSKYYSRNIGVLGLFVILALIWGLLGDIFLDLKYVYPVHDKTYSYAGFIVFGLGHICLQTGIMLTYFNNSIKWWYLALAIILDIIISIITILMEKPLHLKYGSMKLISFLYALCLFGTFSLTLLMAIVYEFKVVTINMLFIGSILFAISDLVLSGTYFGEGKERPIDFILNYLFYYGAQFTIAFSLFFI
ncbi:MAG: hypothetical protein J5666_05175 [Bacilli bacterium]|nr:hypothetical protein [Bacilli bacterium]